MMPIFVLKHFYFLLTYKLLTNEMSLSSLKTPWKKNLKCLRSIILKIFSELTTSGQLDLGPEAPNWSPQDSYLLDSAPLEQQ